MKTNVKNVHDANLKKLGFMMGKSDIDRETYYKVLKGRITKARYKALDRFARRNSNDIPVYSSYDCTGQLCGIYTDIVYGKNKVLIKITFHYDC